MGIVGDSQCSIAPRIDRIDRGTRGQLENQVRLEGTLAKSCEVRYTPSGVMVATLELEHTSEVADADPIKRLELKMPVVSFGALAEVCAALPQGACVRVVGRLNQKRWIRENRIRWGQVEVIATSLEVLCPLPEVVGVCGPQPGRSI